MERVEVEVALETLDFVELACGLPDFGFAFEEEVCFSETAGEELASVSAVQ